MNRGVGLTVGVALLVGLAPHNSAFATPVVPDREWAVTPTTFVDEILYEIPKGQGRRQVWRQIRNRVLEAYGPAGLELRVREQKPVERPTTISSVGGFQLIQQDPSLIPRGEIVGHVAPGSLGYGLANNWTPTAAILGLDTGVIPTSPRRGFRPWKLSKEFSHELGHVLGLAHTTDQTSVMSYIGTAALPSGNDLESLIGPQVGLPDPGDPGFSS